MKRNKSLNRKKAISLIVLVITIIIIVIIATTGVILVAKSEIFHSSTELTFKNDMSQYSDRIKNYFGSKVSDENENIRISGENLVEYIPELKDSKYLDKLYVLDGELVIDGSKITEDEKNWAKEIGIHVSDSLEIIGLDVVTTENTIEIKSINTSGNIPKGVKYKFKLDDNEKESTTSSYTFGKLESGKYYLVNVSIVSSEGQELASYKKNIKTRINNDVVDIKLSTENWTKGPIKVTLEYENIPQAYKIQYKIGKEEFKDYTKEFEVTENNTFIYARLYNKDVGRDTSNNYVEIKNIDKEVPLKPTAISATSGINSIKVRASGSQDSLSGILGYKYSLDGITYTSAIKAYEDYTFTNINADTIKTIYTKAVDNVGNESEVYSKDWATWEASEKVKISIDPSEDLWTNKAVTVSLSHQSIPTNYIMQYRINNGSWTDGYTAKVTENRTKIEARLYNKNLNDEIGLNSLTIGNIDRIAPNVISAEFNPTKNSIITSNLKGIDRGGSGISHYELFIRKHGESNYKSYTTKENTYTFEGLVKDTLYDIRIRVYDNAGNVSDFVESSIPTVCTITLDSQGADSTKEGTKAIYEKYNKGLYDTEDCINEITSIEIPQKGEYTFDGYYTQTGGKGTKMIDENGNITSNFNNKYYTSAGTLYASWKSYTITYNFSENGGTECTKTSEMVKAGKTLDLTQGPTATKLGWKFIGWNTEVDKRAKLNSIVMERKNIVLYAQYSKDVTATCNYYGGTSAVTGTMWNKEKSISIKLPQISNATKDGVTYTKRGWAKEDTANADIVVNSGANVTLSDNAIYYANYQSSMNINIYYCSGDGTSSTSLGNTVEVATASSGRYMNYKGNFVYTSVTLPDVVKNSKGFCGTDYSGISKEKNSTTAATLDTSSTTYYAFYTKDVTLYYYNGSKHTSSVVKRNVTTDATKYTSKEGSTIPTPVSYDGATFKGWSCRPNVVEARYFNATAVAVLYAYYQKTITVSYDKNDGTGTIAPASGTKTYISKAVSTDTSVALTTLNPSITVSDGSGFTRTGYVFSGWNTKADGTGKNYAKSEKAEFSESTTLYAKWTEKYILITFYSNGATEMGSAGKALSSDKKTSTQTTTITWTNRNRHKNTEGTYVTGVDLLNCTSLFSRTGYAIPSNAQAWRYNSATSTTYINQANQDFTSYFGTNVKTEISLYANWQEKKLRVYFYPNGGTAKSGHELITTSGDAHVGASTTYNEVNYSKASDYDLYNCTTLFSKTGYSVPSDAHAWRYNSSTSNTYINQASANLTSYFGSGVVSSIKLYANWTLATYKITLNKNGGTGGADAVYEWYSKGIYKEASHKNLVTGASGGGITTPTKANHRFDGYYTTKTGGTQLINGGGFISNFTDTYFTSNATIYARWICTHDFGNYVTAGNENHRRTCKICGLTQTAAHQASNTKCNSTTLVIESLIETNTTRYIYEAKCSNYDNCKGRVNYYRKISDGKLSPGTIMNYSKYYDSNGNLVGVDKCPRVKCSVCGAWFTP